MTRIHQYDNRVNVTYVYDVEEVYDAETGVKRPRRKLIGKLDPETKELIPTGKRGRPAVKAKKDTTESHPEQSLKAQFMEVIKQKDHSIAALKAENRHLKDTVSRLEKTIQSIRRLCNDIPYGSSEDRTE